MTTTNSQVSTSGVFPQQIAILGRYVGTCQLAGRNNLQIWDIQQRILPQKRGFKQISFWNLEGIQMFTETKQKKLADTTTSLKSCPQFVSLPKLRLVAWDTWVLVNSKSQKKMKSWKLKDVEEHVDNMLDLLSQRISEGFQRYKYRVVK